MTGDAVVFRLGPPRWILHLRPRRVLFELEPLGRHPGPWAGRRQLPDNEPSSAELVDSGSSSAPTSDSAGADALVTRCGTVGGVCLCQSIRKQYLADFEAKGWTATSCAAPADGTCCMDGDFPARPGICECGPIRCQGTTSCLCIITDDPTYKKTSCDSPPCCIYTPTSVVGASCHCGHVCENTPEATPVASCNITTVACGPGQRPGNDLQLSESVRATDAC